MLYISAEDLNNKCALAAVGLGGAEAPPLFAIKLRSYEGAMKIKSERLRASDLNVRYCSVKPVKE